MLEVVRALAPDADHPFHRRLVDDYKRTFQTMRADARLDEEPLFEGVAEVLDDLRDRGWTLGVATLAVVGANLPAVVRQVSRVLAGPHAYGRTTRSGSSAAADPPGRPEPAGAGP